MVSPNLAEALYVMAPVAVEFCSHCCPIQKLDACLGHSLVGCFSCVLFESPRCISHNVDVVSLLNQSQSREGDAYFSQNTTIFLLTTF